MWLTLLFLIILLITLLVYMILAESATIKSYQNQLEHLPPPNPPRRSLKLAMLVIGIGAGETRPPYPPPPL
jgi:hypothetical protein